MSLTITDLFCGAGGSSLGAQAAGMTVTVAANHWQRAIDVHQANFPDVFTRAGFCDIFARASSPERRSYRRQFNSLHAWITAHLEQYWWCGTCCEESGEDTFPFDECYGDEDENVHEDFGPRRCDGRSGVADQRAFDRRCREARVHHRPRSQAHRGPQRNPRSNHSTLTVWRKPVDMTPKNDAVLDLLLALADRPCCHCDGSELVEVDR